MLPRLPTHPSWGPGALGKCTENTSSGQIWWRHLGARDPGLGRIIPQGLPSLSTDTKDQLGVRLLFYSTQKGSLPAL